MDDSEFEDLRDFIYEYCGLFFEEDKRYILQKRLPGRIAAHQLQSFRDYLLYLQFDPNKDEELAELADLLTTNETYFFREDYQLKAFIDEIVPEILARKEDKVLRVWSAGCSTGEEPYTIAMLLRRAMDTMGVSLNRWRIEILGSDISQRVLGVARRAVYGESSFRAMDENYISYFEDFDGGKKRAVDEIRQMVTFSNINLLDDAKIDFVKSMDVIFCRNVIIYFDNKAKRQVVQSFYDKLTDNGYLLLGHSESLMNISTSFELKHLKNDMVYQRPQKSVTESGKEEGV
jgi:chemotaxis protein methyltransferase CheR